MELITPHRPEALSATVDNIRDVLSDVIGKRDPYVILDAGRTGHFMQALWTPRGFLLEFQEEGVTNHFQTIRQDLTLAEVAAAFEGYATGADPAWRGAFLYRQIDPRPAAYLTGLRVGAFLAEYRKLILAALLVGLIVSLRAVGCGA